MASPEIWRPRQQVNDLFMVAHRITNRMVNLEPISTAPQANDMYRSLKEESRDRTHALAEKIGAFRFKNRQAMRGSNGLHVVSPDAHIYGRHYHAAHPEFGMDMFMIFGRDSMGETFAAEELVIRDNDRDFETNDFSVVRTSWTDGRMVPGIYRFPAAQLLTISERLTRFATDGIHRDETTRLVLVSAPDE